MHIRQRHAGWTRGLQATPESIYLNRRELLQSLGLVAIGGASLPLMGGQAQSPGSGSSVRDIKGATGIVDQPIGLSDLYPAKRNEKYKLDRPITEEGVAARYNNFYEFTVEKDRVWMLVDKFRTEPWRIEVGGLVEKPITVDADELIRTMPIEERLYRHRCVETWAMAVPWTGFPLSALLKEVRPKSNATHVRLVSFLRTEEAPGQTEDRSSPWPYQEGLTMAEAMNELTLIATGLYGHPLPKQHGAPIRLVTPWKYGFKSIKSIQRIELMDSQPATFWNTLIPGEYDFNANVNPGRPHPRWSQATEWMIDTKERRKTLLYNGYGEFVARLYG